MLHLAATSLLALGLVASALQSVGTASRGQTGDGTWVLRAPMPTPRQEVAMAEVDGTVYVVGDLGHAASTVVEAYDPRTDTWRALAPMPLGLNPAVAAGVGGKLYVIGGHEGPTSRPASSAVLEYDPRTDTWTEKAPMLFGRGAAAAAVIDGQIYVAGGRIVINAPVIYLAAYDPARDTCTVLAPIPTPRDHLMAGAIGGKLYVAGGRQPGTYLLDTLEVYDPATDTWQQLAAMPTGRSGGAAAVVNGCLYVFGGEGAPRAQYPSGTFDENEVYDPRTNRWERAPAMPTARHGTGAAVIGNEIFLPGGAAMQGGSGVTAVHEVFQAVKSCI